MMTIDGDLRNDECLYYTKYCFDTWKLFEEHLLNSELLREKDDTNHYGSRNFQTSSKFLSSLSIFEKEIYRVTNYYVEKTCALDARYLSIRLQKTMTNSGAYFSIDAPFPIPRMIYMAIN